MSESTVRSLLGKPNANESWTVGVRAGTNTCWYYSVNPNSRVAINRYRVCFKNGRVDEKHHY